MKKRLLVLLMMLLAVPVAFSGCSKEDKNLITSVLEEVSEIIETEDAEEEGLPAEEQTEEVQSGDISEDGWYSDPYDVAEYLITYGHLPSNYITKSEAEALGWESVKGNLWEVAEGMSIGGDKFNNYEKILPEGNYRECDVNYEGGYRGSERLIYSEDMEIYYTEDHYESYVQLY